jgi:UDP-N-acetyl-D-mannosaminuronate dehydrogenase
MKAAKDDVKNVLIVGFGEIGKSMYNVIEKSGKYKMFKKDVEELKLKEKIDVMHVCIPYSENFVDVVAGYITKYKPSLTIINSTVRPGATQKVYEKAGGLVVHSPVRGRHPKLEDGIYRFVKFIGPTTPEAGKKAKEHFDGIGVNSEILKSAVNTEVGKLLCTTYYAVNIAFHQEMNRICAAYGADFDESVTRFNATVTMDIEHKIPRPVMFPGFIGGHCLLPNIELLKKDVKSDFLDDILKSNEKRKKELENSK